MKLRLLKFNKSKFKKDAKDFFRLKNLWLYVLIFVSFVVLGLALHEAGHAFAALLVGAKIKEFVIRLCIYPPFSCGSPSHVSYDLASISALSTSARGFITMMGSTFTLLISAVATICLIKCKLKSHARAAVFVMSLYFMDMFLYTITGILTKGGKYPREALMGAIKLGIPRTVFLTIAWIITLSIIIGIIYSLLKPYLKYDKRSSLTH